MTQTEAFQALLDRYAPEIGDAFRLACRDLATRADLGRMELALETNDIEGALAAVQMDPAVFGDMLDLIEDAYRAGGKAAVETMPTTTIIGAALLMIFNVRHPNAERWIKDQATSTIRDIMRDQQSAIRAALIDAVARGVNPRTASLEIVGRIDRKTGARSGGIIGLSSVQAGHVERARAELASAEPAALRNYLGRARRDKRFDPTIKKAIALKQRVPADIARKAVVQYSNRLLDLRGETIGRKEALTALHASKHEAYRQAVEQGKIPENSIRRTWRDAADSRVRDSHKDLNGDTVGLNEAFETPSGHRLLFPGDGSMGAPASELVNCRCIVNYRVDYLANVRG